MEDGPAPQLPEKVDGQSEGTLEYTDPVDWITKGTSLWLQGQGWPPVLYIWLPRASGQCWVAASFVITPITTLLGFRATIAHN